MRPLEHTSHEDDFILLRYAAGEVDDLERFRVDRHLRTCAICARALEEYRRLDSLLREHGPTLLVDDFQLKADDVFYARPEGEERPPSYFGIEGRILTVRCLEASKEAKGLKDQLLADAEALAGLRLEGLRERLGLGYALDEAPRRISEGPPRWGLFAEAVATRLAREPYRAFRDLAADEMTISEFAYPLAELWARAELLRGIVGNWTGGFETGGEAFARAWRYSEEGKGTDTLFATIELHESQRRTFVGRPAEGVALARRASATFVELGLREDAARADHALGIGLSSLDRDEEALGAFRRAQETFVRSGNWSAYVSALNSGGACLARLGRVEEARSEYVAALRLTRSGDKPATRVFIRYNLARTLLVAGRVEEARRGFRTAQRLFASLGLRADEATARLLEIECLARLGNGAGARTALERLKLDLSGRGVETSMLDELHRALAGEDPDVEALASLVEETEGILRPRLALAR